MRHFTTKDAAHAMGISVAVLRIWEFRYDWPRSVRKDNGYRLFSEQTVAEVREFCAAGRPFSQIKHGEWNRTLPVLPPPVALDLTHADDLEPRWIDALNRRQFGTVAEYLCGLGRMRPAVRAQYVRSAQEANRQTGGAYAHLMKRYQIEGKP